MPELLNKETVLSYIADKITHQTQPHVIKPTYVGQSITNVLNIQYEDCTMAQFLAAYTQGKLVAGTWYKVHYNPRFKACDHSCAVSSTGYTVGDAEIKFEICVLAISGHGISSNAFIVPYYKDHTIDDAYNYWNDKGKDASWFRVCVVVFDAHDANNQKFNGINWIDRTYSQLVITEMTDVVHNITAPFDWINLRFNAKIWYKYSNNDSNSDHKYSFLSIGGDNAVSSMSYEIETDFVEVGLFNKIKYIHTPSTSSAPHCVVDRDFFNIPINLYPKDVYIGGWYSELNGNISTFPNVALMYRSDRDPVDVTDDVMSKLLNIGVYNSRNIVIMGSDVEVIKSVNCLIFSDIVTIKNSSGVFLDFIIKDYMRNELTGLSIQDSDSVYVGWHQSYIDDYVDTSLGLMFVGCLNLKYLAQGYEGEYGKIEVSVKYNGTGNITVAFPVYNAAAGAPISDCNTFLGQSQDDRIQCCSKPLKIYKEYPCSNDRVYLFGLTYGELSGRTWFMHNCDGDSPMLTLVLDTTTTQV